MVVPTVARVASLLLPLFLLLILLLLAFLVLRFQLLLGALEGSVTAGEEEESLAWQRLVEARQQLVAFEADNPTDPGLEAAWESLYIAEGSDWFWWYGLDQDSGYDENWDVLFKVHLSNIYRAVNLDLPPYLQDLWTNPAVPSPAASSSRDRNEGENARDQPSAEK